MTARKQRHCEEAEPTWQSRAVVAWSRWWQVEMAYWIATPFGLAMTARKQRHGEEVEPTRQSHSCHCEARSAVAIQGGGCVVTVVAMAMALLIATPFGCHVALLLAAMASSR